MKSQPYNAKWDASDIRYNVLRWTSSPVPPFGGYGPSFVNPRTGQILGADVMLEFIFVTNRLKYDKLFESAAFQLIDEEQQSGYNYCMAGDYLHQNTLFGQYVLSINTPSEVNLSELV